MTAAFETVMPPLWKEIGSLRQTVRSRLREMGFNAETAQTIEMIISELAENAVKYGDSTGGGVQISLECSEETIKALVACSVKGDADQHVIRLRSHLDWMHSFNDPFLAYIEKMREVASQDPALGESGLGLVRIEYEGAARVDFKLDGDRLYVWGLHRLAPGARA
jgi:two-component sensor histidine kinase